MAAGQDDHTVAVVNDHVAGLLALADCPTLSLMSCSYGTNVTEEGVLRSQELRPQCRVRY